MLVPQVLLVPPPRQIMLLLENMPARHFEIRKVSLLVLLWTLLDLKH
nr:MAG TPA: hypothetical protein [Caudoviricetes sp.]